MKLLISILLFLSVSSPVFGNTLNTIIQASSVRLGNSDYECSGVIVNSKPDRTWILTAKHCTMNELKYAEINGSSKKYIKFGKIIKSYNTDLAVVELFDIGQTNVAKIALSKLNTGESFSIIGLSYDIPWAVARGFVIGNDIKTTVDKHDFSFTPLACMGCDEGDSGAGVFNNNGELEGIWVAYTINRVRTYMVPLSDVKEFLSTIF
jgi:hypothetical protein